MNRILPDKINKILWKKKAKTNFAMDLYRGFLFRFLSQKYFIKAILALRSIGMANFSISFNEYADQFGTGFKNTLIVDLELLDLPKRSLVCTGYSQKAGEAIAISIAETTERLAHFFDIQEYPPAIEFSITTSGCAFHTRPDLAAARACAELIERDGFLIQWFGSETLKSYPISNIQNLIDVQNYVLKNQGQIYLHHFWNEEFQCHSVTLVAHFPNLVSSSRISFFCGLGGHPTLSNAIEDAKEELVRFIRYGFERLFDIDKELSSIRIGSSAARFFLFQKPEYQQGYLSRIQISEDPLTPRQAIELDILDWYSSVIVPSGKFHIRTLPLVMPLQKIGVVIRASNEELQYLDFADKSIINEQRIFKVFGHYSLYNNLHFIP